MSKLVITSTSNAKVKQIVKDYSNVNSLSNSSFYTSEQTIIKHAIENDILISDINTNEFVNSDICINEKIMFKITNDKNVKHIALVNYKRQQLKENTFVYLDGVSDPKNMGLIMKLCVKHEICNLALSKNCVNPFSHKILSIIKDDVFKLNISVLGDKGIMALKNEGYKVFVTALENSIDLNDIKFEKKSIIVFGSEANGTSDAIREIADFKIKIKIENIESLNVSVASAIIMDKFKKEKV